MFILMSPLLSLVVVKFLVDQFLVVVKFLVAME